MESGTGPKRCSRAKGRWGGWCVAASFYLYDVFLRLTVDIVTSQLQRDFALDADGVSALFASSFFYAYAATQLPVGVLLDRAGPRRTIAGAALLSAAGCFMFAGAHAAWVGALARVISGLGCGCGWLGAIKVTRVHRQDTHSTQCHCSDVPTRQRGGLVSDLQLKPSLIRLAGASPRWQH